MCGLFVARHVDNDLARLINPTAPGGRNMQQRHRMPAVCRLLTVDKVKYPLLPSAMCWLRTLACLLGWA